MSVRTKVGVADPPPPPPPGRSRVQLVWVGALCALIGFGAGYLVSHRAAPSELIYTGRLAAICGGIPSPPPQQMAAGQDCFAVSLDPGTAGHDSCYPGAGDLSLPGLGPGFWSMHTAFPGGEAPRVGDHVRVTVLAPEDASCTPIDIQVVPDG